MNPENKNMVRNTNSIDLNELETLVDKALSKETKESLNNFLDTFKMNTDAFKPFDPEVVKRGGAKVVTRDGRSVRIICWDLTNSKYNYTLVALIKEDDGNEYILPFKESRYNYL